MMVRIFETPDYFNTDQQIAINKSKYLYDHDTTRIVNAIGQRLLSVRPNVSTNHVVAILAAFLRHTLILHKTCEQAFLMGILESPMLLLRTLVEINFYIQYILEKDTTERAWLYYSDTRLHFLRTLRTKNALKIDPEDKLREENIINDFKNNQEMAKSKALLEKMKKGKPSLKWYGQTNLYELAKQLEKVDRYLDIYKLTCTLVHAGDPDWHMEGPKYSFDVKPIINTNETLTHLCYISVNYECLEIMRQIMSTRPLTVDEEMLLSAIQLRIMSYTVLDDQKSMIVELENGMKIPYERWKTVISIDEQNRLIVKI